MTKTAPKPVTKPTRRRTLFSGGAVVASLLTPAIANTVASSQTGPSPDAELIEACAEAARCEAWRCQLNNDPREADDDEVTAANNDAWHAAFERLMELPARTPAGFRAKAEAVRLAVLEFVLAGPDFTLANNGHLHEQLAINLCDDIDAVLAKETTA